MTIQFFWSFAGHLYFKMSPGAIETDPLNITTLASYGPCWSR
jgi:hypothetical protein